MSRPRSVGMPWYEEAHYPHLRAILADGERLPASYGRWRLSAEQVEGEVRRSGVEVVRVLIEPQTFAAWCTHRGTPTDGAARALYANETIGAGGA